MDLLLFCSSALDTVYQALTDHSLQVMSTMAGPRPPAHALIDTDDPWP